MMLLPIALASYLTGALSALLFDGKPSRALAAAGAFAGAVATVASGILSRTLPSPPEWEIALFPLGGLAFRIDGLSALFLILIGGVGACCAIYSFGYSKAYEGRYSVRLLGALFNALLLSLTLQVVAANPVTFLFAWEAMSLTSYALVLTEHDRAETLDGARWYFAVSHAGFAALVAMWFLLEPVPTAHPNAVFLLAVFGFGAKAGLVPLHIWLPRAHPVAPSHVSALLSGVVVKMGVYGLLRVVLLMGGGPPWWGGLLLGLGVGSALLGVLYALTERDLKRLLAYSTVENVGIIFIGIGAGLMFQSYGLSNLATLGLVAGLYHALNHASFKGLLFLAAGAVVHATETRNLELLGGLVKRMPRTAAFFLLGSAAISALPPLNGFASEWLVFQTLLGGAQIPKPGVAVVMPIAVGLLALTSGLAAATFVKAFGITFLALPRSPRAEAAQEAPLSMQAGMAGLALASVGLGLAFFFVTPALGAIVSATSSATAAESGEISLPLVALGLVALTLAVLAAFRVFAVNRRVRFADTWGCGRIVQTPRMQYTATSFAEPLRRIFAELYRPSEDLSIDFHPASKYFVQAIEYRSETQPWLESLVYGPALALFRKLATRVRWLQSGSVHLYLAYMTLALFALLLLARWL